MFYFMEYTFYIQDFWVTCAFPEKQRVPWIYCIECIFFIIQDFWATCACPEKQSCPGIFQARGGRPPLAHPRLVRLWLSYPIKVNALLIFFLLLGEIAHQNCCVIEGFRFAVSFPGVCPPCSVFISLPWSELTRAVILTIPLHKGDADESINKVFY